MSFVSGSDSTVVLADGASIAVTTFGEHSQECVVLISGHGGTKTSWDWLADKFVADGFFVITFDNRGAGATKVPGQESFVPPSISADESENQMRQRVKAALFTYDTMADDVPALLDHFGIQTAHIAGASMGGQLTTLVGIRHPTRCASLTVIMSASPLQEMVGFAQKKNPQWFRRLMALDVAAQGDSLEELVRKTTPSWHAMTGPEGGISTFKKHPDLERAASLLAKDLARGAVDLAPAMGKAKVGDSLQGLAGSAWSLTEEAQTIQQYLKTISIPTIFIGGRADPIVLIESQRSTAAQIPGARIYEFDCGHEMPVGTLDAHAVIMLSHFQSAAARVRSKL